MSTQPLLEITQLNVHYGGIHAVQGVNLSVDSGELVALIGANGAGKTSTLKAIAGLLPATGNIRYAGSPVLATPVHQRAAQGLALVPEGRGTFTRMTVLENLHMGAYHRIDTKKSIQHDIDAAFDLFPRLKERATQLAGTLSGGEQQMLAMARAMMAKPKLLLLDEPTMGLAPIMVEKILATISHIHQQGVAVLLVEQNAKIALTMASRAYVLAHGKIQLHDTAAALLSNPSVRAAYLGG